MLCLRRLCEGDEGTAGLYSFHLPVTRYAELKKKPEYWPVYSTLFVPLFTLFYFTTQTSFRQHTVLETNILRPTIISILAASSLGAGDETWGRCETVLRGMGTLPFLIS